MAFTSSYTPGLIQQSEYYYGTPDVSLTGSFTGSFSGDGSQLTGISGGGGSSIDTGSLGSTTITGSLTVSGSGGATIQSSGSTVFSVIGSEGDLFTVTDNLTTGSLFSVKDISGIPLLDVTVNSTITKPSSPRDWALRG